MRACPGILESCFNVLMYKRRNDLLLAMSEVEFFTDVDRKNLHIYFVAVETTNGQQIGDIATYPSATNIN